MSIGSFKLEMEQLFSQIAARIEYKNKAGYTDLNKELEQWLGPIFNRYFNAEFVTEKSIKAPAIDTADRRKRIAIQITSTATNEKIKNTLIQVYKNNYHKEFTNIFIFFLKLQSPDITFNLQSFKTSIDFKKLEKEHEWNDDIFNPAEHVLDFGKIIEKLASHEYANNFTDILSELKNITGHIDGEHLELKNYLAKGKSINEILNPNDVLQSLSIVKDYFGPFIKLPTYIFLKLELFGHRIGTSLTDECLNTSNTQLIDKVKADLAKNIESPIIEFLIQNGVSYIYNKSKNDTTNLRFAYAFIYDNCKICAYRKLEVIDIPKINEDSIEENLLLLIENLYLLVEYGKYEDSILLFEKLLNFTKKEEKYGLTHFHLAYNFKRFYEYYLPSSFIEKKKVLFKNLTNYINGDLWVITFEGIKNKETRQVAENYIKLFHIENQSKILRLIDSVNNILDMDKIGGDSSSMIKNHENEIYRYIWSIYIDTAHNKILFDTEYTNASIVLNKSLELLLSLSSIKNPRSYKLKKIQPFYVEILLNHFSYSDLSKLIQRFKNKADILKREEDKSLIHK